MHTPTKERVLWDAGFVDNVQNYWLLNGGLIMLISVIGIPLLPFWFLVGRRFTSRYLDHMQCTLTTKSVKVKKGVWTRVEKTVPLDKITDMGLVQGPIMRAMGIHVLSIETAGASGAGALIRLTGVDKEEAIREAERPACSVIKHSNPCGLCEGDQQAELLRYAWAGDPISAFGSIIAFNRLVERHTVEFFNLGHEDRSQRKFVEVVVAPDFTSDALAYLQQHKNLRILRFAVSSSLKLTTATSMAVCWHRMPTTIFTINLTW